MAIQLFDNIGIALLSTGKSLLSVLYMTSSSLNLPENLPTYPTFSAGAERGSDSVFVIGSCTEFNNGPPGSCLFLFFLGDFLQGNRHY